MFKTATFVGFTLFFISLFFWLWHFCSIHKFDYTQISSPQQRQTTSPVSLSVYQTRNHLTRQLYTSQGDFFLTTALSADHSLLQLLPQGNAPGNQKLELFEHLENVRVASQEKIEIDATVPSQVVHYLTAEEAHWRHKASTLLADNGAFSILRLPGKNLPSIENLSLTSPLVRVNLDNIRLWIEDGKPHFDADRVASSLSNL